MLKEILEILENDARTSAKQIATMTGGKADEVKTALSEFSSAVDKAAKRGVIHGNKADNLKSKAALKVAAGSKA